MTNNPMYM